MPPDAETFNVQQLIVDPRLHWGWIEVGGNRIAVIGITLPGSSQPVNFASAPHSLRLLHEWLGTVVAALPEEAPRGLNS